MADAKNLIFSSTFVVSGSAEAAVYAVGMATEMGKIAKMITEEEPDKTPLEKSLATLGKVISAFALTATAIIFLSGIIVGQAGILKSFMTAVAVAVAAIPEGMPAVVTVIMAMGVTRMSKKRVIIRKLKSVETLGGCNYICTDKTGTLTNNKLKVEDVWFLNVNGAFGYGVLHDKLINCIRVCNSVKGKRGAYIGDSTEIALLNYADLNGFETAFEKIWEKPFDSNRKLMSVMVKTGGAVQLYIKGAPDVLIKKCTKILTPAGERRIAQEEIKKVVSETENYSKKAMRVLAFAYKNGSFRDEEDLTFIGLCAMIDGVKEGAALSVSECKRAGITTVMITGDHADTAFAVAKKVGIAEDKGQVILGEELDDLPPKLRKEEVLNKRVFARVTTKHKNYVVKTLKANGNVVAMTGDGINDAPSIKSADIGVAMGSGTDVTKSAADMVLQDDNFATIVSAVGEGRKIYENIRKAIQFLLSSNLSEVISVFIATMMGFTLLRPMHLLWINLITDTFPALALGMEEGESDLMKRAPRKPDEGIFAGGLGLNVVLQGIFIGLVTLMSYLIGHMIENNWVWEWTIPNGVSPDGMTMAFLTLSLTESFHSFNARSLNHSIFSVKKQNKWLWGAFVLSILLTVFVVFTPGVNRMFGFESITLTEFAIAVGLAILIIPFAEISKLIANAIRKAKK